MIELGLGAVCFAVFVAFELFAQALDRLSPIKLRGLLEEEPASSISFRAEPRFPR
jgi:hypothetical protein